MKPDNPFYRLVSPGTIPGRGHLFVEIDYRKGRLSITGVEGPCSNGDCRGSYGQTGIAADIQPNTEEGWDMGKIEKLARVWGRWHLNDMRAGCVHQRRDWDVEEGGLLMKPCPVCGYKYGSAWLTERVPPAVLGFLRRLKDTGCVYPWGRRRGAA